MNKAFDDVLIEPQFSMVRSRKDVSLNQTFLGMNLTLPVVSSNMDTVTGPEMASAMNLGGGIGCLHRFSTIEENVKAFYDSCDKIYNSNSKHFNKPLVSIGVGDNEFSRALALAEAGATHFVIDVAHGASIQVVEMYDRLRNNPSFDNKYIIVGNFATAKSIDMFNKTSRSKRKPDAFKVGIGPGSMCTTRVVTGSGLPLLASIQDCANSGFPLIADGGMRSSGDIAKALAAGASVVMLGGMLAGTDETPGELVNEHGFRVVPNNKTGMFKTITYGESFETLAENIKFHKKYRGSASSDSYNVQNKTASHRSPEGESTLVAYKGPVSKVLEQIDGGLRSSLSYSGCFNLTEFRINAKLVDITFASNQESQAHGK